MALFTSIRPGEADSIADAFGLSGPVQVQPADGGSVNSNYFLTHDGRMYFLRVYEEQTPEGAAREVKILKLLHGRGLPVPWPLERSEVLCVRGKPIQLFHAAEGRPLCSRYARTEHIRQVGRALARIHQYGKELAPGLSEGRFSLDGVQMRLSEALTRAPATLRKEAEGISSRLERVVSSRSPIEPLTLIHGDLFPDNTLAVDDTLTAIVDWESASAGHAAYDLMVTLLSWCYGDHLDRDRARELVRAYEEVSPLRSAQWLSLRRHGICACLRFAVTRFTDYELRKGARGLGYRDFRRFLERLRVLDHFTDDGFARWLRP